MAQAVADVLNRHNPMRELPVTCARPVGNFIHRTLHRLSTGIYTSSRQSSQQVRIVLGHPLLGSAQLLDPLACMHDGGVVATAELLTDLRILKFDGADTWRVIGERRGI